MFPGEFPFTFFLWSFHQFSRWPLEKSGELDFPKEEMYFTPGKTSEKKLKAFHLFSREFPWIPWKSLNFPRIP